MCVCLCLEVCICVCKRETISVGVCMWVREWEVVSMHGRLCLDMCLTACVCVCLSLSVALSSFHKLTPFSGDWHLGGAASSPLWFTLSVLHQCVCVHVYVCVSSSAWAAVITRMTQCVFVCVEMFRSAFTPLPLPVSSAAACHRSELQTASRADPPPLLHTWLTLHQCFDFYNFLVDCHHLTSMFSISDLH